MKKVEKLGLTIALDPVHEGYYRVAVWVEHTERGIGITEYFDHLTYTESIDVMLAVFDDNRPGQQMHLGAVQEPLW